MTNPISVGSTIVNPSAPAIALEKAGASGASGFAVLLEGTVSGARQNPANFIGAPATPPETLLPEAQALDLETLFDALGGLFSQLLGIEEGLEDEQPVEAGALETLSGLIETVTDLLDTGAVIDPDSPLLAQLHGLAQTLGIEMKAEATSPAAILETLAALATRIGAELRETAPELATALTGLAARLDTQIAAIETALANAEPDAATKLKLVESETKPNASAAIAQNSTTEKPPATATRTAPEETPDISQPQQDKSARVEQTGRSLTGDGDETPARPATTGAQTNPQATAAAAAASAAGTATTEAQTDAPDGLTLPAGHAQPPGQAHGAVRPEAAAYARPEPRINVPHIAVEIARSIQNGISRFEIRLNPPELGRVDVRIEMDNSGNVLARLAVEKSETLDLLQRDQRALERALVEAGLDGNKTDLEFSLRQENRGDDQPPERHHWTASVAADPAAADPSLLPSGAMRGYARLDAVNLWV